MATNASNPTPPEPALLSSPARRKMNWLVFGIVFLAPALLTILAVLLGARAGDTAPAVAICGGSIAGIVCGAMLGCHVGRTTVLKVVLGIVFMAVFGVVCIGMSCFGCLTSGYQLNF